MKVLIFSGGTGSKALQAGFSNLFTNFEDNKEVRVVINCYDNGLSTGAVRKVMDSKILGPSDLRKNQLLQAASNNLTFYLQQRVSASDAKDMKKKMIKAIPDGTSLKEVKFINASIKAFFEEEEAELVTYDDFSISNIIYAGVAKINGYSLELAGIEIAKNLLNLNPESTMLVSDENLFLQAIAEDGTLILDEGDIVDWGNKKNKIVDVQLVNRKNVITIPKVSDVVKERIAEADLIVFSSGTQWSSLIPTYLHEGFKEAIENASAKKYLVMNNVADEDMTGIDSSQLIDILDKYLPMKSITTIFNSEANEDMQVIPDNYSTIIGQLSGPKESTHNAHSLVALMLLDYYENLQGVDNYVFDFDDTLFGRKNSFAYESSDNLLRFISSRSNVIVTGNSLNHINEVFTKQIGVPEWYPARTRYVYEIKGNIVNDIYCDGGNSYCTFSSKKQKFVFRDYVDKKFVLTKKQTATISAAAIKAGIPINKIENRNNLIISIKPLGPKQRPKMFEVLKSKIGDDFDLYMNGRTTIDICAKDYSKKVVLKHSTLKDRKILYFGDELDSGNDSAMKGQPNVECISVENPRETNFYLKLICN